MIHPKGIFPQLIVAHKRGRLSMEQTTKPELIVDAQCEIGEGPLWHPEENRIYWTDIPQGRLFRYDPATQNYEQFYDGDVVGGFTIQADGSLLFFMGKGAIRTWKDGTLSTVFEGYPEDRETRFNDVIADPKGRVFCGTIPPEGGLARLYRLDTDGTLDLILDDVGLSNGMGFTLDRKTFYYTDSTSRKIYSFDYEIETGHLTNQTVFLETNPDDGVPDGLTVDSEGYVWSAYHGGGCIVRYTSDGREERRISVSTKLVTSLTFGGADRTDIYITSAGGGREENGGGLFRVNLGITGMEEFLSRIGL